MISAKNRFHGHGSLKYVYKNGANVRTRFFAMKFVPNTRRTNYRLAVIVSKKVFKSAVRRNRIRRRVYEIMRTELQSYNPRFDMAITVFAPDVFDAPANELRRQVRTLLQLAEIK